METNQSSQTAAIIVGHGSLLSDAGVAMVRIAEKLHQAQIVPIVRAGFLNFSQPTFAETVASVVEEGATQILVLPYFLIAGAYVSNDLQQLVDSVQRQYPHLQFKISEVIGTHSAMVELAVSRLNGMVANSQRSALLFVAHGTPLENANQPIDHVLRHVQSQLGYDEALTAYLDCNQPNIPAAFAQLAGRGVSQIDVLPYFLHLGRHVRRDLPAHFDAARQQHRTLDIRVARHLDDEALLSRICAERIQEQIN